MKYITLYTMIHSSNTKGKILIVNIPLCILNFTEIYPSLLYKESKGHPF